MTVQQDSGLQTIRINERIARFHILSTFIFKNRSGKEYLDDTEYFDLFQNVEQLRKVLQTLSELYQDSTASLDTEPEFRSYYLLSHLKDPEIYSKVIHWKRSLLLKDPIISRALTAVNLFHQGNYKAYRRMLSLTPLNDDPRYGVFVLQNLLMLDHIETFQENTLSVFKTAFKLPFDYAWLTSCFGFTSPSSIQRLLIGEKVAYTETEMYTSLRSLIESLDLVELLYGKAQRAEMSLLSKSVSGSAAVPRIAEAGALDNSNPSSSQLPESLKSKFPVPSQPNGNICPPTTSASSQASDGSASVPLSAVGDIIKSNLTRVPTPDKARVARDLMNSLLVEATRLQMRQLLERTIVASTMFSSLQHQVITSFLYLFVGRMLVGKLIFEGLVKEVLASTMRQSALKVSVSKLTIYLALETAAEKWRQFKKSQKKYQAFLASSRAALVSFFSRDPFIANDGIGCGHEFWPFSGNRQSTIISINLSGCLESIEADLSTLFLKRITDPYQRHHVAFIELAIEIGRMFLLEVSKASLEKTPLLPGWSHDPSVPVMQVLSNLGLNISESSVECILTYVLGHVYRLISSSLCSNREENIKVLSVLWNWSSSKYSGKIKAYIDYCQATTLALWSDSNCTINIKPTQLASTSVLAPHANSRPRPSWKATRNNDWDALMRDLESVKNLSEKYKSSLSSLL